MIFVGIDPGQDGAIALLDNNAELVTYEKFSNWKKIFSFLMKLKSDETSVCIEKLHAMPIRGSIANFSLGGNYNTWKALLEILNLSYTEVPPQTWQQKILNTSKKKSKETKPLSIQYVNKRYPNLNFEFKRAKDLKENSGITDAINIALYGRFVRSNNL